MTTYHGHCLCGAVRFSVEVSKPEIDCCHCSMCRRWGGGPAFSVHADGPPRFEDETALGIYRSSDWGERLFCKTCGSSILWRSVDGRFQAVPASVIGDPAEMALALEIFVDDQPGYYALAGERKRMTGAEVMTAFAVKSD